VKRVPSVKLHQTKLEGGISHLIFPVIDKKSVV